MSLATFHPLHGRCSCDQVQYRVLRPPLFVHCCHCTHCQRETGSAFAINALLEAEAIAIDQGTLEAIDTPSSSGKGQIIVRCRRCKIALWSHYGGNRAIKFLRVSTLQDPNACPPDIHIYTSTKQRWVLLPSDVPAVPEYYRRSAYWSEASIARLKAAVGT